VLPGIFAQTHDHPELVGQSFVEIRWRGDAHRAGMDRNGAMRVLRRYELDGQGDPSFGSR